MWLWQGGSTSEELRRHFRIGPNDTVLDVGCGSLPFPLATHLTDLTFSDDSGRLGPIAKSERPMYECPAHDMPFADGEFDFVFCCHVLEHVRDPAASCREIMRVGRRGYVEAPRSWLEYIYPAPEHRWLVDHEEDILVFRQLLEREQADLLDKRYEILDRLEDPVFLASWNAPEVRQVRNVQLYWENSFRFRVIPKKDRYHASRFQWFHGAGQDVPPATGARAARSSDDATR